MLVSILVVQKKGMSKQRGSHWTWKTLKNSESEYPWKSLENSWNFVIFNLNPEKGV